MVSVIPSITYFPEELGLALRHGRTLTDLIEFNKAVDGICVALHLPVLNNLSMLV